MSVSSGRSRLRECFADAWRGLATVFRTEWNFRVHLGVLVVVVVAGFAFGLERWEWCAVLAVAALVLVTEAFNTALEYFADTVHPEVDPGIRKTKDAGAGAVLVAAVAAAVVGAIVFLPKIWEFTAKWFEE